VRGGAGAAARIGEMQARNGAGVLGGIETRGGDRPRAVCGVPVALRGTKKFVVTEPH